MIPLRNPEMPPFEAIEAPQTTAPLARPTAPLPAYWPVTSAKSQTIESGPRRLAGLPTAYCLLPTALCLLPTAFSNRRPLPSAQCLLQKLRNRQRHILAPRPRGDLHADG